MDKIYTLNNIGIGIASRAEITHYASVPIDPEILILDPPVGGCTEPITLLAYRLDTEEVIGSSILYNYSKWYNSIEFGTRIWDSDNWNKGYGTEIAILTLTYAFYVKSVYEVHLKVLPINTRAIKSYRKAGFSDLRFEYIEGYSFLRMVKYRE